MKKDKPKGKGGGISYRSDDAIETGLFASGPATVNEAVFAKYDYGGSAKPVPVLLVTYSREGEENYEQPYSLGKGWNVKDGVLVPMQGQSGLPKSCNAIRHLIKPLEKALEESDAPTDFLDDFPSCIEGLEVVVSRVAQEKREIKGSKTKGDDKERTILEIETITGAPWIKGSANGNGNKAKVKAKGKTMAEADADDDEEDEQPKKKGKRPADEDDDEAPVKAKGKGKAAADEDDDDDTSSDNDDDALLEEGIEALLSALEAEGGPIALDDLDDALAAQLKKNPKRKQIIAHMTDPDVLENEKGWTWNSKKKTVTTD